MVGYRILNLRKERDLTQADLGKMLGVGRTTIHSYENDVINTPPDKLLKLSEIFDVSVDYLVGNSPFRKEADVKELEYDVELQMQLIVEMLTSKKKVCFNGMQLTLDERYALRKFISGNIEMIKALMHNLKD